MTRRKRRKAKRQITSAQTSLMIGLCLLSLSILTFLGFISQDRGFLIKLWLGVLYSAFGRGAYVLPLIFSFAGLWVLLARMDNSLSLPWPRMVGALICFVCALALVHLFVRGPQQAVTAGRGGGYVGYGISQGLTLALGKLGATVVLITAIGVGLVMPLETSLDELIQDSGELVQTASAWLAERRASRAQSANTKKVTEPPQTVEPPPESQEEETPSPPKKAPSPPPPPPVERRIAPIEDRVFHRWELPEIDGVFEERGEETKDGGRCLRAEFRLTARNGTVGDPQIFALLRQIAQRHRWNSMEKRLAR